MAKEKKQFRELSDEELEKVTGGYVNIKIIDDGDIIDISPDLPDIDVPIPTSCPPGTRRSTDEKSNAVCVPIV